MTRRGVIRFWGILTGLAALAFLAVATRPNLVLADSLTISNISVTQVPGANGGGIDVTVHFSTNQTAIGQVSLNDQTDPNAQPIFQLSPNPQTQHSLTLPHIPNGQFNVRIEARSSTGGTAVDNSHTITVSGSGGSFQPVNPTGSTIQQPCTANCAPSSQDNAANSSAASFPFPVADSNGTNKITNFKVTIIDNRTAEITFDQSSPSDGGIVYAQSVADQTVLSIFPQPGATHQDVTFCNLETSAAYHFAAHIGGVQTDSQNYATYIDPKTYQLTGGPATPPKGCSPLANTQPGGQNFSPINSTAASGPVNQILFGFFGGTWLHIGQRALTGADVLWWVYLILLGISALLAIYFVGKRRRLWGVVYDARSKQPLELAVVRLFDEATHKLLETRVTNHSGRYTFLAEPGEFYLEVTKEGYHFPSRIITQKIDNEYTNLYRGEIIKLGQGQSLIAPDIPIDSQDGALVRANLFRRVLFPLLDNIRLPLILIGLILDFLIGATTHLGLSKAFGLKQFLIAGPIVLLAIEFLLIRRNGRR